MNKPVYGKNQLNKSVGGAVKSNKLLSVIFAGIFLIALLQAGSAATSSPSSDYAYLTETTQSFLPASIHAGDIVSLSVNVKNKGSSINIIDLNGSIELNGQFESAEFSNDSINFINPGATKTLLFKFKVKDDTLPGYYPVFLTLTYSRDDKQVNETRSISVPVSGTEKNIDVTVNPRTINPGNQSDLVFTLKNIGGTPVSNISFSWTEANDLILPLGSDNKRYVSVLNSNESADLTYVVAADPGITTGIYPLTITLSFIDSNGSRTQSSRVGLIVGGETDFEVSAEMSAAGQLSLSIANIGSNNAGAVVVKLVEPQGIVSGSSIQILGDLDKGDFTLANFETTQSRISTTADSTAQYNRQQGFNLPIPGLGRMGGNSGTNNSGTNSLTQATGGDSTTGNNRAFSRNALNQIVLEIDYTDTTGERKSVQKTVKLSSAAGTSAVSSANARNSGQQFPLIPLGLLALILGGAIVFNKFKAKKSWKILGLILGAIIAVFIAMYFLFSSMLLIGLVLVSIALLAWFFLKFKEKQPEKKKVI